MFIRLTNLSKSIGFKLTLWYTLAVSATLACVFIAGYQLLQNHLMLGLDGQNASELKVIKIHVFRDFNQQDPLFIDKRMRIPSDRTAALFFIDIRDKKTGAVFLSSNLKDQTIPNPQNLSLFNADIPGVGELRVAQFLENTLLIKIGTPLQAVHEVMATYAKICLALLAAMILVSVAIGFAFSRLALNPIKLISDTANRIHSDNLSQRIPVSDVQDEISDLSRMLNQMFDRLESSFRQIRQFAADASHELKTPLSLVRLHAEKMLLNGNLSHVDEESVRVQLEELARLDQIIEELLFLSRAEARAITLVLQRSDPSPLLLSFAQDARVLAEHYGLHFKHVHEGEGIVALDEKRLRQVLLNLLSNAIHVSPPDGQITLRSRIDAEHWRLTLEDQGPGLPDGEYERIFERFVRLQLSTTHYEGSGLGLAICRSIISLHQGRIFAQPNPDGCGLQMVIELPSQLADGIVKPPVLDMAPTHVA